MRQVELVGPDGEATGITPFLGNGRFTLVTLWASWCAICQAEMDGFRQLAASCPDAVDAVFVSPSLSSFARDAEKFGSYGLPWAIYGIAASMLTPQRYAAYSDFVAAGPKGELATPVHYLFNGNGRLETVIFGGLAPSTLMRAFCPLR